MRAKGCDIIWIRKILFTIKPKCSLMYNKCVAEKTNRTHEEHQKRYKLFTWGLLEASVLALLSFRAFPSLFRVCFTLDIQCKSLLTLSPCSLFSSSTDLCNENRWIFNKIVSLLQKKKPQSGNPKREGHCQTTFIIRLKTPKLKNHCQLHQTWF